ncbi:twin-arginine translocation signal domain-containing protein [Campylobacter jejuni]|nr:twin-arginine translocation signal domain-containing protein [Campylobacter jejuni]
MGEFSRRDFIKTACISVGAFVGGKIKCNHRKIK